MRLEIKDGEISGSEVHTGPAPPIASSQALRPVDIRGAANLTPPSQTLVSDAMKTLPLRDLLRQPARVKKLIAAGHEVRVTNRGKPLWIIQPDRPAGTRAAADDDDDDIFWRELLGSPRSGWPSACRLLIESRR